MSSARRKPGKKPFAMERYRAEAKGEPFVLYVTDEETITVPRPTANQMFEAEEARNSREGIRALCGEKAGEILELIGDEDFEVGNAVFTDIGRHFGLGE